MLKRLVWDSGFWGFHVGELVFESVDRRLPGTRQLDEFTVVQARVDPNDNGLFHELIHIGFAPAGNRVELERTVSSSEPSILEMPPDAIWSSSLGDADVTVYSEVFVQHSRFRYFPVSKDRVVDFYRTWIGAALTRSHDDGLWSMSSGGHSMGFFTYRQVEGTIRIGLLAVAPRFRGRGVAALLLKHLEALARDRGAKRLAVATEGTNHIARRIYARDGFLPTNEVLWMYRTR